MAKDNKKKVKSSKNLSPSKIKLKSADEVSEFAENIINTVREPLLVLDKDLRVVKASHAFYDFFKVSSEEAIGTLIYDLGNRQWNIPKLRELLETILREKTSFDNYEVEHVFSSIGKRIMLLNARQIKRAFGQEKIILLAIEDITERKLAEEAILESEAKFRQTFDLSPVGIVMVGLDKKFLLSNNSFSHSFGYLTEELIGKYIDDITLTEDRHIGAAEMKTIANGEIDTANVQKRYLHKDGKIIWGETTINLIRNLEGDPQYFLAIMQNITERKRAEEELRKSEKQYSDLVNNALVGVYKITFDGNIMFANEAMLNMMEYKGDDITH